LALDNPPPFFKTHRSIINNKSELGIRAESFSPELSSPLEMNSARVKQPGKSSKGRNVIMKLQTWTRILIGIFCFGLLPTIEAVVPAPDRGMPDLRRQKEAMLFKTSPPVLATRQLVGTRFLQIRPAT
jgi:hypothetical protein